MENMVEKSPVMHVPTDEEAQAIKKMVLDKSAANGEPAPLVFKVLLCDGKTQFIVKWLSANGWQDIVNNKDYQKQLNENPEAADNFMRMKIFSECVLWPPTFNPALSERNQKYPAGVLGALLDKIMFASGFTQDAAPDKVLVAPPEPVEPTDEELTEIMQNHPLASVFGTAFEKPFFVRDYNAELGDYELLVTRYYIYTQIDSKNYKAMREEPSDDKAAEMILNACVLWPKNINWETEPANYGEWLIKSILTQSGIGIDPSTGIEEI